MSFNALNLLCKASGCHLTGNSFSFFDRLDAKPSDLDTFHLNLQVGRSSFDVPNTLDQQDAGQNQHQEITTFNVAPGYSRVIGSNVLFTANAFVRRTYRKRWEVTGL